MKKTIAIVLAVLLCVLSLAACAEETVPAPTLAFDPSGNELEVKLLSFFEGSGSVTNAGTVNETDGKLCLTGEVMNGTAEETESGYLYAIPEAFFTLRKRENVDGILLYWGNAYGVAVTDSGEKMIYTLDETLEARTWTEFYNQALRWQNADGQTSGGTGLK